LIRKGKEFSIGGFCAIFQEDQNLEKGVGVGWGGTSPSTRLNNLRVEGRKGSREDEGRQGVKYESKEVLGIVNRQGPAHKERRAYRGDSSLGSGSGLRAMGRNGGKLKIRKFWGGFVL